MKKLLLTISLLSCAGTVLAHNAKENSHGCHDGENGYHCHGKGVADTQRTINKKIVVQPSYMSNKKVILKKERENKAVEWKDGFVNRKEILAMELQEHLNYFYGSDLKIDGIINSEAINLIIQFQSEHGMIRDGMPSEELLKKLKEQLKNNGS